MDEKQNNKIIIAGAGLLLLILVGFAITGARSEPASVADGPRIDLSAISTVTSEDNIRGPQNAAVKLIEYSDIECPFCQEYHEELLDLVERDQLANFSWTYRHFPLTQIHQNAFDYAVATECAAEQNGFDDYIDTIVNRVRGDEDLSRDDLISLADNQGLNQTSFSACLDSDSAIQRVTSEAAEAQAAGATGTPFTVFEFNRQITAAELETIQGLFGASTRINLSDDGTKMAVGGAIGSTQIREIVNTVVDPAQDQIVEDISEGTQE
jgi:protein-disulfide isomerase